MTPAEITALITALGGGIILRDGAGWVIRKVTGRERQRRDDTEKAWSHYDKEAKQRRRVERHAAVLEMMLVRAPCVDHKDIPPWPATGHTGPTDTKGTP